MIVSFVISGALPEIMLHNAASLQASLDLADAGVQVHLVETTPFLGKNGNESVPEIQFNTRLLEISRHPNIKVWTNTLINRSEGELGAYQVELKQHPRYVDLSRCTACGECIEVCPVTVPGTDHKVIYLDGQPSVMAIEKFGKEAKVLKQLFHHSIPKCVDSFAREVDGEIRFYIVTQYVEGKSIGDLVQDGKKFSEEQAKDVLRQMLEIMKYLQGFPTPILHRDLKPNNIVIDAQGKCWLVDFGNAVLTPPESRGGLRVPRW